MSDLKMKIIGVVGTAKNTGKTTTLSALMEEGIKRGFKVGLTSIGYDGEEIDNVTLLPKPRLNVVKGSIVATSEQCLKTAQAKVRIIEQTNLSISLGDVFIAEITEPGLIVLAGPNKRSPLEDVLQKLKEKVDFILIDGAMNRIVPLMSAEGLVFATGAARTTNLKKLAEEMYAIYEIFSYPSINRETSKTNQIKKKYISENVVIISRNNIKKELSISSILDKSDAKSLISELSKEAEIIIIPGIVAQKPLEMIAKHLITLKRKFEIIFSNPTSLLVAGEPLAIKKNLNILSKHKVSISYIWNLPILGVTINPFYPKLTNRRGNFQPAYVDVDKMSNIFKDLLPIPIINIHNEGADKLFDFCFEKG